MSTSIVLTFLSLLILGVLLILLGRRGRKINNHPQCTWCGFDLVGVYPGAVTCPECGAGLARTHGQKPVRQGVRVRQPILIATGLALVLIAAAPLGLFTYAAITGTPIAKHLPLRGLELMANLGTQTRADEAAAELTDRLLKKSLDAEQSSRAVDLVLAYQADANRPWTRPWADLLERVNLNALLTPEQSRQVLDNAVKPTIKARPSAARGRNAMVEITPGSPRLATNEFVASDFMFRNWRINGKPQSTTRKHNLLMFEEPTWPGPTPLQNSGSWTLSRQLGGPANASRTDAPNGGVVIVSTRVRSDTPLGPATLTVDVDLQDTAFGSQQSSNLYKSVKNLVLSMPIQIVDSPYEVIQPRTLTGAELEAFRKALHPGTVEISFTGYTPKPGGNDGQDVYIDLRLGSGLQPMTPRGPINRIPDGAAFLVEVEIEGTSYTVGSVVAGQYLDPIDEEMHKPGMTRFGGETELLRLPKATTASVRFKPLFELAEDEPGMTWFYNAEVVLENVPIRMRDFREDKSKPLSELRGIPWREREKHKFTQSSNPPDDTEPEDQPTNP